MSVSHLQLENEALHIVHDVLGVDKRSSSLRRARHYTAIGLLLFVFSLLLTFGLSTIEWQVIPASASLLALAETHAGLALGIAISTGILSVFFAIFSISEIQRTINLHDWFVARYMLMIEEAGLDKARSERREIKGYKGLVQEPEQQPRLPIAS